MTLYQVLKVVNVGAVRSVLGIAEPMVHSIVAEECDACLCVSLAD